jgi:hypothetical protein
MLKEAEEEAFHIRINHRTVVVDKASQGNIQ